MSTCSAVVHHGPGHQSRTRCEVNGQHDIHSAELPSGTATWRGDVAYTDAVNRPPDVDEAVYTPGYAIPADGPAPEPDTRRPIAVVDCETTGLHPWQHYVWEGAVIMLHPVPDPAEPDVALPYGHVRIAGRGYSATRWLWQLPCPLDGADPFALDIGHYWERRWQRLPDSELSPIIGESIEGAWPLHTSPDMVRCVIPEDRMREWAHRFMLLTKDAFLVGAVPSFDERRLGDLLRLHGAMPAWHYQPVCVEVLASGVLAERRRWVGDDKFARIYQGIDPVPPWDSTALTRAMGLDPDRYAAGKHTAMGDCEWALDLLVKAYATVDDKDRGLDAPVEWRS